MAHCFSFAGERELLIGSERERDMNDKCDPDVNLKISLSLSLSLSLNNVNTVYHPSLTLTHYRKQQS